MAKYNVRTTASPVMAVKPAAGVIGTKKSAPRVKTGEGHLGYERKDKSALFLLAAGSLGGEDKFYESGNASTARLKELVRKVAVKDAEWTAKFLKWLRSEGNIRTAAVVGAIEAADAMVKAGITGGRQIVASVLQRADEPGEAMAYWLATRGRKVPMPKAIKRGIADGALKLYNEYSFQKYDSSRSAVRFGDVIEMTHPAITRAVAEGIFPDELVGEVELGKVSDEHLRRDEKINDWLVRTPDLFRWAIEVRQGRNTEPAETLVMIRAMRELRRRFEKTPRIILQSENLKAAGMNWEDALSMAGDKLPKGEVWKAMLPQLGYMALIRNLRNLDEHGVKDADVAEAIARISSPAQVRRSRQLPYRFYSAYKNAPSLRWGHALDVALNESLQNIPVLGGRTLVLIDTSGSMSGTNLSGKSTMTYQEVAGLFGIALGLKNEADVWMWASSAKLFQTKGTSVLRNLEEYQRQNGLVGHGTDLDQAITKAYVPGKYARMVVISDMQVMPYRAGVLPTDIPSYFFNLAGYRAAAVQTKGRVYELGGLTDHTFKMIPMLEAGETGQWPWE